jgi:hypothetical protein
MAKDRILEAMRLSVGIEGFGPSDTRSQSTRGTSTPRRPADSSLSRGTRETAA